MASERKREKNGEPLGGLQSLRRAMSILQTVAASPQGIGLSDISKVVGLHNSTAFHIAKTLVAIGLLRQEPESRHYRVGPRLFGIAAGALDELELLDVAQPIMIKLAQSTEATSHVAVRAGQDVVIIGKYEGPSAIRVAERIGSARPPHATAIGKVVLASLSEADLTDFFRRSSLTSYTPSTIVDELRLRQELEEVRKTGLAIDNGEFDPELRCFAAPARDFRRSVVAAVGVTVPVWRLRLSRVGELTALVKQAADTLSEALGFAEGRSTGTVTARHT
jgi:DNA-binding IclR family transcriptional regulator